VISDDLHGVNANFDYLMHLSIFLLATYFINKCNICVSKLGLHKHVHKFYQANKALMYNIINLMIATNIGFPSKKVYIEFLN
jgi:uncharacterized membrane protein YcgQ (UPF0703/DUF1980 family)